MWAQVDGRTVKVYRSLPIDKIWWLARIMNAGVSVTKKMDLAHSAELVTAVGKGGRKEGVQVTRGVDGVTSAQMRETHLPQR